MSVYCTGTCLSLLSGLLFPQNIEGNAKDVLNPSTVNQLVRLDEGYFIFRTLRNSPVYLGKRKKDLFAMIRQLGLPT
jgi:hypothetical protein